MFFFEKKNQETFIRLLASAQGQEVFFASFFFRKKKTLSWGTAPCP
jgi:hypothetical protein